MKPIPEFHRRIFWDVDFDALDCENDTACINTRVFDRGDVPDIRHCRRYYGDEKIRDHLLNTQFTTEVRTYLAAAVPDRPLTDFRCFSLRQSNPELFPY